MTKYFIKIGIVFLLFFSICACTKKSALDKTSIYVAIESAPKSLDPRFATDANGQRMTNLLFQSFVRLGPEMNIIGEAANQWALSERRLNLQVPKKVFFSDGQPLTKEDIEFSFQEYTKPENIFSSSFKIIERVEVLERELYFEVKVHLKQSSATLLTDLTNLKVLPKKIVSKYGLDFGEHLVGSGRYKFLKREHNNYLFTENTFFTGEKPHTKNLVFKVVKDDNTRFLKILKGSVDISANALSAQSNLKLITNPNFSAYKSSGLSMNYLLLNMKDPHLKSKDFRKSIALSIDKKTIIDYKLEGLATSASSLLTPGNPYFEKELTIPEFDLELAKKIFSKLPNKAKEISIKSSNSPSAVENARVIANQLEQLGLKVKLESFEWGTFYGDIKSGNFQIATMRWVGATDPDIYRIAFHSKELPPGRNRGYYQNPQLDLLLDQGVKILDEKKRIEHYSKVQKIVAQDLPIIPLWYGTQVDIVNKSIKNFRPSLTGDFSYFYLLEK